MKTVESSELLLVPKGGQRDEIVYGTELRGRDAARRCVDLLLSLALLVLLLPLMLVVALLVKLDSPGPVFFRQRRLGRDKQPFTVIKFRTMFEGAPPRLHQEYIAGLANGRVNGDGLKKLSADPRVTRVGRVLRRLSLDELPQLLNVLAGSMSLIGPRPALEYELEHYQPRHYARFEVRPGITGLWQVSGRNSLGFMEMLDLDVEYATNGTLSTDLRILVRTPGAAVRHAA
jgi:lipopolysaccharide/colanic/teichoic acid biosynthesis glycosyltransferase